MDLPRYSFETDEQYAARLERAAAEAGPAPSGGDTAASETTHQTTTTTPTISPPSAEGSGVVSFLPGWLLIPLAVALFSLWFRAYRRKLINQHQRRRPLIRRLNRRQIETPADPPFQVFTVKHL